MNKITIDEILNQLEKAYTYYGAHDASAGTARLAAKAAILEQLLSLMPEKRLTIKASNPEAARQMNIENQILDEVEKAIKEYLK